MTAVWSGKVSHLWALALQNLYYIGFPHPATGPKWTAKPEPCEFIWSALSTKTTV